MKQLETKRILVLAIISLFISTTAFSQNAFEKGNILFDVGIGFGVYKTEVKSEIGGVSSTKKDGGVAVLIPIKAQYGISDKFSIGLMFQPANYFVDSSETTNEEATGGSFRLLANYYLVNKEKFVLYSELGFGTANFKQSDDPKDGDKFSADWSGSTFNLGIGIRYYFTEHVGFFSNVAYNSYSFDLDEVTINQETFKNLNWDATFSGTEITVGIAVKL